MVAISTKNRTVPALFLFKSNPPRQRVRALEAETDGLLNEVLEV
jgi:hypothetical protein